MNAKLEVRGLNKNYAGRNVVHDFSLAIEEGKFVVLLGPSGCGKSTILSMIAGFETADTGSIVLDGQLLNPLPPQDRHLGLVMQDFSVFTRMSVRQNLEFGLKGSAGGKGRIRAKVDRMAERLLLTDLLDRSAATLNFSEMQRVALARSLIVEPSLLLLDEPISSLDAADRSRLRSELRLIQNELHQTILYVTHDQTEALSMADEIVVLQSGETEQAGTPREVYEKPRNRYVAEFLGEPSINLLACQVERSDQTTLFRIGPDLTWRTQPGFPFTGPAHLGIRPADLITSPEPRTGWFSSTVIGREYVGSDELVHLSLAGQPMTAFASRMHGITGQTAWVSWQSGSAHVFDQVSGTTVATILLGSVR
jgi:ABC-type sugar transport system ATPase subunit